MSCRQRPLASPRTPLSKSVKPQPPGFYRGTLFPRSGNEIRGIFGSIRTALGVTRLQEPPPGPGTSSQGGKGGMPCRQRPLASPSPGPSPPTRNHLDVEDPKTNQKRTTRTWLGSPSYSPRSTWPAGVVSRPAVGRRVEMVLRPPLPRPSPLPVP